MNYGNFKHLNNKDIIICILVKVLIRFGSSENKAYQNNETAHKHQTIITNLYLIFVVVCWINLQHATFIYLKNVNNNTALDSFNKGVAKTWVATTF